MDFSPQPFQCMYVCVKVGPLCQPWGQTNQTFFPMSAFLQQRKLRFWHLIDISLFNLYQFSKSCWFYHLLIKGGLLQCFALRRLSVIMIAFISIKSMDWAAFFCLNPTEGSDTPRVWWPNPTQSRQVYCISCLNPTRTRCSWVCAVFSGSHLIILITLNDTKKEAWTHVDHFLVQNIYKTQILGYQWVLSGSVWVSPHNTY